jgi:hypothetical protein
VGTVDRKMALVRHRLCSLSQAENVIVSKESPFQAHSTVFRMKSGMVRKDCPFQGPVYFPCWTEIEYTNYEKKNCSFQARKGWRVGSEKSATSSRAWVEE